MRTLLKKAGLGLMAWTIGGSAVAFAETLTWAQVMQEAARNNGELKAAVASLRASDESLRGSQSNFYPQVATSVGYGQSGSLASGSSLFTGDASDSKGSYNASLSLSQSIFSGWADQARVDQSKATRMSSEAQLNETKAKVSRDLKAAFAGLSFAQRLLTMQEDITRRRQENLKLVTLRYESGSENKGSVLLSQAYLDQAKLESLQTRNSLQVAQAELAQVLGRDLTTALQVQDEIPTVTPAAPPDFGQLARQTPFHQQSESKVSSAQAAVVVARAGFFPTLSLSGNLGRQGDQWFPDRESWTLGVSLNYPLYSGGRDRAATYAAASNLIAAEASRSQSDRAQVTQLQQTYAAWLEAIENVKVENSFFQAAKLRAEIARNKYNNGLSTFEDWDLIESELIKRQRSILQSQRDRVVAEANWEQTQGKGVFR